MTKKPVTNNETADTVFPTSLGVRAYLNNDGDIVLVQEAGAYDAEASVIVVPVIHGERLRKRILELMEAAGGENS